MTSVDPVVPARRPAVLSRGLARELGIPVTTLAGPGFQKLFYDAYVPAGQRVTTLVRARTALELVPEATRISHHTAVMLWGGVAPDTSEVHLSTSCRERRSKRRGIVCHLADPRTPSTRHRGVAISTPTQAFLELAATGVSLVDLVIAGDSLVKATRVSPSTFIAAAREWTGQRARLAREAARLVREGVDSPMETKLRLLIVFAGLPEPRVNLILRDTDGNWLCRFELAYEECQLAVEYDGRQHAYDDEQWGHDIDRRELLDRLRWRTLTVRSGGIYHDPERTLRRVRTALAERGATGLPKRFATEWTRHFPGKG